MNTPAFALEMSPSPRLEAFVWDVAYHSGMSARSDLRACVDAGAPVGVVAGLLASAQLMLVLPGYLRAGGEVFVDTGAFGAFRTGEPMDWDKVFSAYSCLITMSNATRNLTVVAPDVVGDQDASVELWREHKERICGWIDDGVRVIVPLQSGQLPADELLAVAKEILGTDNFCAGIPSNLAAMSAGECALIRHHDFHVLGRVVVNDEVRAKVDALIRSNPNAKLTADANWMRSRIGKITRAGDGKRHCNMSSPRTKAVFEVLVADQFHSAA